MIQFMVMWVLWHLCQMSQITLNLFTDAIEDSTQDLWIWLHRHGKNMVGEWVIMWINEMRDDWKAERVDAPIFHTYVKISK